MVQIILVRTSKEDQVFRILNLSICPMQHATAKNEMSVAILIHSK